MFGQNLALRGPAGSMVKAVGMMAEYQRHVLIVYSSSFLTLGIATIFCFYVYMDAVRYLVTNTLYLQFFISHSLGPTCVQ